MDALYPTLPEFTARNLAILDGIARHNINSNIITRCPEKTQDTLYSTALNVAATDATSPDATETEKKFMITMARLREPRTAPNATLQNCTLHKHQ